MERLGHTRTKKEAMTAKKSPVTSLKSEKTKGAAKAQTNRTEKLVATPKAPSVLQTFEGYWLMKSEPETYSIDDFERDRKTLWTGVRNYQARNFMMTAMKPGDQVFFYHSNAEPSAIVGIGEILKVNIPDPTALDSKSDYFDPKASVDHPIWFCAEVGFRGRLKAPLSLADLRLQPKLIDLLLLQKGQRLSVQPVSKKHFELILSLAGGTSK